MTTISDKSKQIIIQFLEEWWGDLTWKVRETKIGTELPYSTGEELLGTGFGWLLQDIAKIAETRPAWDADTAGETLDACQQVCEWMFARPGMPGAYQIPQEFWGIPIGDLVLRSHLWARRDELLTLSEASEITGRSLSDLSNMVDRGKLAAFPAPDERNPQRSARVTRSQVEALPKKRTRKMQ